MHSNNSLINKVESSILCETRLFDIGKQESVVINIRLSTKHLQIHTFSYFETNVCIK